MNVGSGEVNFMAHSHVLPHILTIVTNSQEKEFIQQLIQGHPWRWLSTYPEISSRSAADMSVHSRVTRRNTAGGFVGFVQATYAFSGARISGVRGPSAS